MTPFLLKFLSSHTMQDRSSLIIIVVPRIETDDDQDLDGKEGTNLLPIVFERSNQSIEPNVCF